MEVWRIDFTGMQSWSVAGCISLKEKGVEDKTAWLLHIFCSPTDLSVMEAHMHTGVLRPLATDLIKNVVGALTGKILWVAIDEVKESTLCGYAKIQQREKGFRLEGDAVVLADLAIVANVPIFVSQKIIEEFAITIEEWEGIAQRERKRKLLEKLKNLNDDDLEKFKV